MKKLFGVVTKQMDEIEKRMAKVLLSLRREGSSPHVKGDTDVQALFNRLVSKTVHVRPA